MDELSGLVVSLRAEMQKFQDKKVKSAGTRARATLLNIKKLADVMRKQILAESKGPEPKAPKPQKPQKAEPEESDDMPPEPPVLKREPSAVPKPKSANRKPRVPKA